MQVVYMACDTFGTLCVSIGEFELFTYLPSECVWLVPGTFNEEE